MSDPGLSHRLRQRSRRAGFMIGISMVLTIALCAVGFTVIYTALDSYTSDFVSQAETEPTEGEQVAQDNPEEPVETPTTAPEENAAAEQPTQAANANSDGNTTEQTPTPSPAPTPSPTAEDEFTPDYQIGSVTINLREGPSVSTSIVDVLPPATPLQYLNEDAPAERPQDGDRWMRFETDEGAQGWVREIDVTEYEP